VLDFYAPQQPMRQQHEERIRHRRKVLSPEYKQHTLLLRSGTDREKLIKMFQTARGAAGGATLSASANRRRHGRGRQVMLLTSRDQRDPVTAR